MFHLLSSSVVAVRVYSLNKYIYIMRVRVLHDLKGQSHQDLVLHKNPMKVLILIANPLTVA